MGRIYKDEATTKYIKTIAQKIIDILIEENLDYWTYEAVMQEVRFKAENTAKF